MRYLLVTTTIIAGLAYTSSALAQTCTAAPSCEEMGYTKSETDCTGKISLRCPFDLSAYLCGAVGSCDFSDYPLTECPTGGNCSNITCDGTTKHKLNSCNSGYTMSGNTCTVNCDFSDYPLDTCPTGSKCSSYKCGGTTKYKCQSGYNKSGSKCVQATITGPCFDRDVYCIDSCAQFDQAGRCCRCDYDADCDYESSYGTAFGLTYEGAELFLDDQIANAGASRCYIEGCDADGSYGIYCYY